MSLARRKLWNGNGGQLALAEARTPPVYAPSGGLIDAFPKVGAPTIKKKKGGGEAPGALKAR